MLTFLRILLQLLNFQFQGAYLCGLCANVTSKSGILLLQFTIAPLQNTILINKLKKRLGHYA